MTTAEIQAPVVAIGDVHGCASLLRETLCPHLGSGAELIFLGDLIDRAPEADGDQRVLELVRGLQAHPAAHGLGRGNGAAGQPRADAARCPGGGVVWGSNGAVGVERRQSSLSAGSPRAPALAGRSTPHRHPNVPLHQQQQDDLLWIRGSFLKGRHGLPYTVVHGHTYRQDFRITRLPYRIGIDTGAFRSGKLTALPLDPWAVPLTCH